MKQFGFLKFVAIGLGIVALLVGAGLFLNRGARVRLEGKILKTRIIRTDDNAAVVMLDFRFRNPADVPFLVKEVRLTAEMPDGEMVQSDAVAQMDLDRVLEYNKLAGPRYTPMLMARDRINSQKGDDRTAAGAFAVSEAKLNGRKRILLKIYDSDGDVAVIEEDPR